MGDTLTAKRKGELLELSARLGVEFKELSPAAQALTHTSYANEAKRKTDHNERLEFLGDAVLELASSTYLYQHFPQMPEGQLTKIRASIVCSRRPWRNWRGLGHGRASAPGPRRRNGRRP